MPKFDVSDRCGSGTCKNRKAFPQRCLEALELTVQYSICFELNEIEFTIPDDFGLALGLGLYLFE